MKIAGMKAPRFRAPPGHGGAVRWFPECSRLLTCRGGVPTGAAVFVATNLRSQEQSKNHRCFMQFNMEMGSLFHPVCLWPQASCPFSWEIIYRNLTFHGLRLAAGAPRLR